MVSPVAPVAFGIAGLELVPGDHVCAFYRGLTERDEIGERCFIQPSSASDEFLTKIADVSDGSAKAGQAEFQKRQQHLGGCASPWDTGNRGAHAGNINACCMAAGWRQPRESANCGVEIWSSQVMP